MDESERTRAKSLENEFKKNKLFYLQIDTKLRNSTHPF